MNTGHWSRCFVAVAGALFNLGWSHYNKKTVQEVQTGLWNLEWMAS